MAASRTGVGFRWIRKYRVLFILPAIVFIIQIALALKFFRIESGSLRSQELVSSGKKDSLEVSLSNSQILNERHYKDNNYLPADDEDSPGNSNPVINNNNPGNNPVRIKLPPDKYVKSVINSKEAIDSIPTVYNRTRLKVEELDFVPICDVTVTDAISAIHRARTQLCKQELVNITCLIQQGKLYAKTLPNYCPSKGHTLGKSIGCYQDKKNYRVLSGYFSNLKSNNSPQQCIYLCLQSGFTYAGVQYGYECFCGNDLTDINERLPDSSCDMKCPGDPDVNCGGYFKIHVFETGLNRYVPLIPDNTPAVDDTSARIAFILSLNGRGIRQVRRLIKNLYHAHHYFFIHVDARQDYLFRQVLPLQHQFNNVKVANSRLATIWGGASLLQMLLFCMKELLAKRDWHWDFVINLSESDFPIKTNDQLVQFLTANKGRNFVKSHGREAQRFIQKQGLDKTFYECEAHMYRIGERTLPWGIQLDGGSDWITLSKDFVRYIVEEKDELIRGLETVFRHTLLPAESFFHTVLRNSRFCSTYVDNNLHVTNWKRKSGCKCQYKHVVDWCGCSPNDFRPEDWPRLQGTEGRQLYFARKFEPIVNQVIIDQLEEWLYGVSSNTGSQAALSYWQSIYHYADLSPAYDDALITISTSLSRMNMKSLGEITQKCKFQFLRVFEVTSYHHRDMYQGTLVSYEAKSLKKIIRLETWVKPFHNFRVLKATGHIGRLKALVVSSDYDQKEQLLRNSFRSLGPFSEPSLYHQWGPGSSFNVTCIWVDPTDNVAGAYQVTVNEGLYVNFVKPAFKQPLRPGVWTVKLMYEGSTAAETYFLITPLQFLSGNEITSQQAILFHNGSSQSYNNNDIFDSDIPSEYKTEYKSALLNKATSNSRRFGPDLWEWIDSLTAKFYSIQDTCIFEDIHHRKTEDVCDNFLLEPCHMTTWSSYTPDPKSEIKGVDQSTGRLVR